MKIITVMFLSLCSYASIHAQIRGNKEVITRTFPFDDITSIYIGLYADITIDCSVQSFLEITAEENLFEYIDRSVTNRQLHLDQKEWIEPNHHIVIRIGAPGLKSITQSTHDKTNIKNINSDIFTVQAESGTLMLEGKTDILKIEAEVSDIIAKELDVRVADIILTSWGTVQLNRPTILSGSIENGGTISYDDGPTSLDVRVGEDAELINRAEKVINEETSTRYIKFKIKNNSWKRVNAYVIGPKPDGKKFSYGFPMRPGQVRDKNWTIGSKVYRESTLGTKKLLVEITEEDEGKVVNLFTKSND